MATDIRVHFLGNLVDKIVEDRGWQVRSYPVEARVGSCASELKVEYAWNFWEVRNEGSGAA
jgi:hypothetical protein